MQFGYSPSGVAIGTQLGSDLPLNTRMYVVGTYNGQTNEVKLYINGVLNSIGTYG